MMVNLLFQWLLARGYVVENLQELFREAATTFEEHDKSTVDSKNKLLKDN